MTDRHQLESRRFTTLSACLREAEQLLEVGERLELVIPKEKQEQFELEVEGWRSLGKVKVRFI